MARAAQSCLLKSRRHDLFILPKGQTLSSFCFSAARAGTEHYVERTGPAPLKNKKRNCVGLAYSINRSSLRRVLRNQNGRPLILRVRRDGGGFLADHQPRSRVPCFGSNSSNN